MKRVLMYTIVCITGRNCSERYTMFIIVGFTDCIVVGRCSIWDADVNAETSQFGDQDGTRYGDGDVREKILIRIFQR